MFYLICEQGKDTNFPPCSETLSFCLFQCSLMSFKTIISQVYCSPIHLLLGIYPIISPWTKSTSKLQADCIPSQPLRTTSQYPLPSPLLSSPPGLPYHFHTVFTFLTVWHHHQQSFRRGPLSTPPDAMKIHSYHFKRVGGDIQNEGGMEIVHIHHWLLGYHCLALHVQWGEWEMQWMTNAQNCK